MAVCSDNPRVGIIGCGATYGGELQHSVAEVDWSDQPDGRAHVTGTTAQIESLWRGDRMRHWTEMKSGLRMTDGRRLRYPPPESPDYPRGNANQPSGAESAMSGAGE